LCVDTSKCDTIHGVKIHLVDGTYELFRVFFGAPSARSPGGDEVGATRGLLRTLLYLLRKNDVTHVAAAFDTVIESFRNDLYEGYKTGEGIDPDLFSQFPLAERAAHALGIVVWSMIDFEADDALATGAAQWKQIPEVEQVVICSPDKDLAQCVEEDRVVTWDRRRDVVRNQSAVLERFGVEPKSIPDWLALVGDSADGFPGISGWGEKSSSLVLHRYGHLEEIPRDETDWDVAVRGAKRLAKNLREAEAEVELYRRLAVLRTDVPIKEDLEDLKWRGARREELENLCREIGDEEFLDRVPSWRDDDPVPF
jgi:5'-3' exonuclease